MRTTQRTYMTLPDYIIKAAQHAAGVQPDGVVGGKTLAALREYDDECPDFDCGVDVERLVVSVAQHAAGLRGKDIDGKLGPKTEGAVRAYLGKHMDKATATASQPAFQTRMATWQPAAGSAPAIYRHGNIDLREPGLFVPPGGLAEIPNHKSMKSVYGDADKLGKDAMQKRLVALEGLPGRFNRGDGRLHGVHALVAPHLRLALELCRDFGVIDEIYRIGTYNHRHMRHDPKLPLSFHAYGIGLDLNPRENYAWSPQGQEKNIQPFSDGWWKKYPRGLSEVLVLCFKKAGFAWGGDWPSFRDPMHFELVR
jgi:peptidoglycan hydrolase-like protein with peptidoglycan-binding domain